MLKLVTKILSAPVTLPIRGARWVAEEVLEEARRQYYDPEAIRAQLAALNEELERGEIGEAEFLEREDVLLERLEDAYEWQEIWSEEEGE